MAKRTYRIWEAGEEEACGKTVEGYWPEEAATTFADQLFNDSAGEFTEGTLCVREGDGEVRRFSVTSDYEIRFYAEAAEDEPAGA